MTAVPCGGCTLCCKHEIVTLHIDEGDDPSLYGDGVREGIPRRPGLAPVLKHKPNGDCFFLGDAGCTIYDKRPVICRSFDCRRAFLKIRNRFTRNQRRQMVRAGHLDMAVYRRGEELADTLFDQPDDLSAELSTIST